MKKYVSQVVFVVLVLSAAITYAGAIDNLRIHKGEACGYYGGQKVVLTPICQATFKRVL